MNFRKINYYFFLSIFFIVTIKCLEFPSQTIHAQIWAEAGTNFFLHGVTDNIWQNIWTVDAGYLPWLQRLFALLFLKGFHVISWYAFAIQITSVFCIAIFCSVINLKKFRTLFPSDFIRFILGVSIAFIPDYELQSFINFAYYGFLPVLLFLFVQKEKMNKSLFWIVFVPLLLLIISKPHFLTLLPIIIYLAWDSYKRKKFRSLIFYSFALAGFLLQIISLKLHPEHWGKTVSIFKIVGEIIYTSLAIYKHVFLGDYVLGNIFGFILYLVVLSIIFLLFLYRQLQEKDKTVLYFFIVCNTIAFLSIAMTIVTVKAIFPPAMPFFGVPNDRHFVFANTAVLLAGMVVLQSFIKKRWILILITIAIVLNSSAFGYFFDKTNAKKISFSSFDQYRIPQTSYSQWRMYAPLTAQKSYCIPINPFPWMIKKDCDYLNKPQETQISNSVGREYSLAKKYPRSKTWRIQSIILVNIPHKNIFKKIMIVAYDIKGKKLAEAVQITPNTSYNYVYFLFPKAVGSIATLKFFENDKPIAVTQDFIFLGTK